MNKIVEKLSAIFSKTPIIGKYFTEEFIRFIFIGGTSFIIFYTFNNSFVLGLDALIDSDNDIVRGLIVWNSYITGYIIAFIYNFSMSKNWTFKDAHMDEKGDVFQLEIEDRKRHKKMRIQVLKFFLINTCNAVAGAVVVTLLDYAGIPPWITQPFFIGLQMIWTYALYKFWVFPVKQSKNIMKSK